MSRWDFMKVVLIIIDIMKEISSKTEISIWFCVCECMCITKTVVEDLTVASTVLDLKIIELLLIFQTLSMWH